MFAPSLPVKRSSREDPATGEGIVLLEIRRCSADAPRLLKETLQETRVNLAGRAAEASTSFVFDGVRSEASYDALVESSKLLSSGASSW
jgi:hypothetical protein